MENCCTICNKPLNEDEELFFHMREKHYDPDLTQDGDYGLLEYDLKLQKREREQSRDEHTMLIANNIYQNK